MEKKFHALIVQCGRYSGLMFSALDPRLGCPGLSPDWETVLCSWFLGKTFYPHSASLHQVV